MRKYIFILLSVICISVNAQTYMEVLHKDGTIENILVSDIDNITYKTLECSTGYVDMGLPSGTMWAVCNLGAESQEDFGDYFSWGETTGYNTGKRYFSNSTYSFFTTSEPVQIDDGLYDYKNKGFTKYVIGGSNGYNGYVDDKTELDSEDDAASMTFGEEWKIPSYKQWKELIDNCEGCWTTINNVSGYKMTSKNGNCIFLPAAGYIYSDKFCLIGKSGLYWSSSLCDNCIYANQSLFDSNHIQPKYQGSRCNGLPIRPVKTK